MFKKVALIVLFVGVTVGVAYLLFRFFFATPPVAPPPSTGGTTPGTVGGLPTAGTATPTGTAQPGATGLTPSANVSAVANGGVTATRSVSNDLVLSPVATSGGGLNYYDSSDDHFYHVGPDGTAQTMSAQKFPSASDVKWAPAGNKAIIEFPDGSKVVYDFAKQAQVTIPTHWEDPTFTSSGSSIVAKSMALDPDSRWLVSMTSDGSQTKLIEPLGENGDKVTVSVSPDDTIVAFSDTAEPVGFDTRDLLPIGQNSENYKALRVDGFGFTPKWSPDTEHLLYSTASQLNLYLPTLWFVNASGDSIGAGRSSLGVHTWADKCTFSGSTTVYCAVPDSLPEGAGLQRDIADNTPDHIEAIDLKSGTTRTIARPEQDVTIKTMTVSEDGSSLFYTDASGQLKEMKLR